MSSVLTTVTSAALVLASGATADFIGWTSTTRVVSGGYLVNVFAVTDNSTDVLLNLAGGSPGLPTEGFVTTNSLGGFRQGIGNQSVFAPTGSQNWTTLDSFLTVGGGLNTTTNAWTGNSATSGDPRWNVTYTDTDTGEETTVSSFSTPDNDSGFTNPNVNSVPAAASWFIAGSSSPARNLAPLAPIRNGFGSSGGINFGSSSAAAASGTAGMLVAQLYVAELGNSKFIDWKMSATMRRLDGTTSNATFQMRVGQVPPPPPPDSDGDGVPNSTDPCPTVPGPCNGCPLNACGTCGTAPDTDNDGRPNCQDNCPTVPNPTQADCDGDGQGDACETVPDCNGNGRPDNCDITAGSSTDFDANGVPDECQPDCNLNGIPDRFDISSGRSSDLNSDGKPDDCQGGVMVDIQTENLGAPAATEARVHAFTALPKAESSVSITVDARGDLDNSVEWIDVSLNGSAPYRLFQNTGSLCPATPDRAVITLSRADFNALIGQSSTLTAVLSCPMTVDGTECRSNGLTQLRLRYTGIDPATGDCNGNDRLDVVETFDGTTPDCNLNRVPDSCDIARGGVADCNQNGVPDPCELAGNPSLDCNGNGLLDGCEIAGGSPDIDGNGKPDDCQTVTVPGQFASIQAAIAAAPVGELRIISVAAGTYPGPVDFLGKPVIVRGASAATTTISGAGGATSSVVRFTGGTSSLAALERVTVRGGTTGSPIGDTQVFLVGGGVLFDGSAANLRDCVIESNFASFGGGGYWRNSTGRIERCTFRGNSSGADGGGLQVLGGAVTVVDSVVEGNASNGRGGGIHAVGGRPTLTRVIVRSNQSSNLVGGISWVPGGDSTAFLTMQQCEVTGNSAAVTQGGIGIVADGATGKASLAGSTVCGNLPRPNIAGPWTNLGGNTVCVCIADLNGDDAVNGNDLGVLLAAWGPCTSGECAPDLNGDLAVDGNDLGTLLSRWGQCPP